MGTILEVTVDAPDVEQGRKSIRAAIAVARRLDRELTVYDPESPLSRFNGAAGRGESPIPSDLYRALEESRSLWQATGGVFDPSVGPLLRLWGEARRNRRLPADVEIEAARRLVGLDKLRLESPDRAALELPGMSLDLGGIGKGYAVDRMAERLREMGVTAALVNFGESSVRALGAPDGREAWEIWIRRGNDRVGPVRLSDAALSTSRSLARSREVAGTRIGDIIDPRSGRPLGSDCQATVRSPSATRAEAWSKALLLDPTVTFAALERGGENAGFLVCADGVRASPLFAALVEN
jgi:thiamine biosynthesis lipoprotein